MELRSQRQKPSSPQSRRPQYPQVEVQSAPTSPTSSVFQSSSSLSSLSSNYTTMSQQSPNMLHNPQVGLVSAPLPSPSAAQPSSYFGSMASQNPTSHPAQHSQRYSSGQADGQRYVGQRGGSGGMPETAPFLKDFNLVAEAAKRAQMACLTRDLGDVGL